MSPQATPSRSMRRWALALYWTAMFLLTHWPEINRYEPAGGWPIPHFEEVMHFSTYAGWVIMWWWLLSARGRRVSQTASNWIILGGAVYAGFDELTQALVERHPEVGDFLLDVFGVLIASSICQLWQRSFWLRRSRQGRQA